MKEKILLVGGDLNESGGPAEFNRTLKEGLSEHFEIEYSSRKNIYKYFFIPKKKYKAIIASSNNTLSLLFSLKKIFSKNPTKLIFVLHGRMGKEVKSKPKKKILEIIEKLSIYASDKVVFVSQMFLDDEFGFAKQQLKRKFTVIPNGITTKSRSSQKNKFGKDQIKIIYSGGEREEKGSTLLRSFIDKIPAQEHNNFEIYAYGFNEVKKETKGSLTINFLPWVAEENFEQQLEEADIFLSLSKYETFGIALAKAYLYGCKIVAFEKAGALELISKYPQVFTFENYEYTDLYKAYNKALELDLSLISVENLFMRNEMIYSYKKIILE